MFVSSVENSLEFHSFHSEGFFFLFFKRELINLKADEVSRLKVTTASSGSVFWFVERVEPIFAKIIQTEMYRSSALKHEARQISLARNFVCNTN